MNGFEFTKLIRATEKGRVLPIIGMSAVIFSLIENEYKASGMNDYLDKPFSVVKLNSLLQQYGIPLKNST